MAKELDIARVDSVILNVEERGSPADEAWDRLKLALAEREAELARVKGELRYDDADRAEGNYLPASAVSRAEAETEALHARIEAIAVELEKRAEQACKDEKEKVGWIEAAADGGYAEGLFTAATLIHTTLGSSDE